MFCCREVDFEATIINTSVWFEISYLSLWKHLKLFWRNPDDIPLLVDNKVDIHNDYSPLLDNHI